MIPFLNIKDRFAKEKFSVGLDIGTSLMKIVKLKLAKEGVELCGLNFEPVQLDLEQAIKSVARSVDALKVNVSFSGPATIIRYAHFLKMNDAELRQALRYEAQKHIPFPLSEVHLDGYALKQDLPDSKMLVLLAAIKRDFLNQRLKLFEGSGLKVQVADIDSLALINTFNFNYSQEEKKDKAVALLNIGASHSNLNILEDSVPRFSRDIPIAGNQFTQRIADSFSVDFKSAEALKLDPGKEKQGKIFACVEPVLSNLAGEVRISCDYYESQSASSVGKMYLSGGTSVLEGLKEYLTNLLGIEVDYWDALKKISVAKGVDAGKIKTLSSQLAVAIGLALRG